MPAPEELTPKTPGEPLGTITPLAPDAAGITGAGDPPKDDTAPALYVAKHIAGGRWHVVTNDAEAKRVGDFVGDKVTVLVELDRLLAGGEPFVQEPKDDTAAKPQVKPAPTGDIDASSLKQPVMTPDGWLCPEPPVKG
jgi:hypothetical protein